MDTVRILKDLKWIFQHYGKVNLTIEEIADYTREDPETIRYAAFLGLLGEGNEETGYNTFYVVYWHNELDMRQKIALQSSMLMHVRLNNMGRKAALKCETKKWKITYLKNGNMTINVNLGNGKRKSVYARDEEVLYAKAEAAVLEEKQRQLLEVIGGTNTAQIEALSRQIQQTLRQGNSSTTELKLYPEKKQDTEKKKSNIPTFEEAFKLWCKHLRKEEIVANQTVDRHNCAYNRHIAIHKNFVKKPVSEITTNDIYNILHAVIKSKVTKKEFNEPRQVLRDTLGYIISEDKYDFEIKVDFQTVELKLKNQGAKFITKKRIEKAITEAEYDNYFEAIEALLKKYPYKKAKYYLVKLNTFLGLREAELGALTVKDFYLDDPGNEYVSINKAEIHYREVDKDGNYTGRRIYEISHTKTENGVREIPLSPEAVEVAKELIAYHKRRGYRNPELLYDGQNGKLRDRVGKLYHTYALVAKKCGKTTEDFRSHLQRKTLATNLVNSNVEYNLIKEILGHSSIDTTLRYYVISEKDTMKKKKQAIELSFAKKVDSDQKVC